MPMDFCDTFSGSSSVFGSLTSHFSNGASVKATNGNDFLRTFTVSGGQIDASSVKTGITQAFIGYAFTPTLKNITYRCTDYWRTFDWRAKTNT